MQVRPARPCLHKIGITQKPSRRFESLNDDNSGKNRVMRVIYVKGYEEKEAWVKNYFSNRAYFYHPLRGNGATEVFRFTWLDLAIITLSMEWWAIMDDWKASLVWSALKLGAVWLGIEYLFPGITGVLIEETWKLLETFSFTPPTA
jgi:hypothetical protein